MGLPSAYLLRLGLAGRCMLDLGSGTKKRIGGRKIRREDMPDLLENGVERRGRLQQVICYKVVENGGIGFGGVEGKVKIHS